MVKNKTLPKALQNIHPRGGGWYELPGGVKVRGREIVAALSEAANIMQYSGNEGTLSGRFRFLRQAGLQYKGLRDVYSAAGYVPEGSESFDHYWALYERDPVAGAIVDKPAKTTWRTPPEVFAGTEPDLDNDFTKAWKVMAKRLKVWRAFERVDRLGRIGQYAVLFIGVREGEDAHLQEPLDSLPGKEKDVLYLSAYAQKYATIEVWEHDTSSVRFGLPKLYKINLSGGVANFPNKNITVHHSRIIHVAEDALVDDVHGRPALKRVLNVLADLLKVTAATGEAYWQLAARVLQASIDSDAEVPQPVLDGMGEALEEIVHDLRRQFVGQGAKLEWLKGDVPQGGDTLDMFKALAGVGSNIPTRILFGSEQGQLASSQDERAFFGSINERQEQHAEPNILRAFIDRMVMVGALPQPGEQNYMVVWLPLFELSESDKASANRTRASAAKDLTPMGGDPRQLVKIDEEGNVRLLPGAEALAEGPGLRGDGDGDGDGDLVLPDDGDLDLGVDLDE